MGIIKTLISDMANGVSLNDLPFFLLRLFLSGIVAYLFVKSLPSTEQSGIARFILPLSMIVSFVSIIVEHYEAAALVVLAAAVLTRLPNEISLLQWAAMLLSLMFAVAIGIGHVLLALIAFAIIYPFYFTAVRGKQ